jgi:hypothetical protein
VAYQGHHHSHASIMHLLAEAGLPIVSLGRSRTQHRRRSCPHQARGHRS